MPVPRLGEEFGVVFVLWEVVTEWSDLGGSNS